MKIASFIVASMLATPIAEAGVATLTWVEPTKNTDGSALTNLRGVRVYRRCTDIALAFVVEKPKGTTTFTDTIPDDGRTCWWKVTAIDTQASESAFSNEVSKTFPLLVPTTRPFAPSLRRS